MLCFGDTARDVQVTDGDLGHGVCVHMSVRFDKKLLTGTVLVNKYYLSVADILLKLGHKFVKILALLFVKGVQLC